MQAIILAAGMGKRLKELTQDRTKCMVQVNGVALIDRMLHQIESRHLSRIVIVVGYEGEKLMKYIDTLGIRTPIVYVQNPIYDKTNNIYSLALAKDYLCQDDTLLFESDLIFEDAVIDQLLDDPRETLALVDKYESWMDGTCVKLGPDDSIASFVPSKNFRFEEAHEYYKTVNIYKFGRHFSRTHYVPFLEAYSKALGNNEYYEQVLRVIAMLDDPEIRAKRLSGQLWYEIDDIQDLDIASSMFAQDPDLRVSLMQGRYGGYWRYPQLLDFCYLVNPYFPPQRLIDEIQANFTSLLTQYPSGMRVNALLAARNFAVHQQNILVGNGAAELIKALMARLEGVTGFIRPTFEEYPNRYQDRPNVCFTPAGPDFRYTADDLMAFFGPQDIDNLVLINPDNPTGNYIPAPDVLRLADWAQGKGIRLILDESFLGARTGSSRCRPRCRTGRGTPCPWPPRRRSASPRRARSPSAGRRSCGPGPGPGSGRSAPPRCRWCRCRRRGRRRGPGPGSGTGSPWPPPASPAGGPPRPRPDRPACTVPPRSCPGRSWPRP